MRLTIDSDEPLDDVLRVVGGLYGVTLVTGRADPGQTSGSDANGRAARRRRSQPTAGRQASASPLDAKAVRGWAANNGYEVSTRGALPAAVRDAYLAAHPG